MLKESWQNIPHIPKHGGNALAYALKNKRKYLTRHVGGEKSFALQWLWFHMNACKTNKRHSNESYNAKHGVRPIRQ